MSTTLEPHVAERNGAARSAEATATTLRVVKAEEVRKVAEALQSIRGAPAYVVNRAGELVVTTAPVSGDEILITCSPPWTVVDRRHFLTHTATRESGTTVDMMKFDAVFTSEAAFEKFALPYYAGYFEPTELEVLRTNFNQPGVYALVHLPKSEPSTITETAMFVTETRLVPLSSFL
jgi:hypothetical protein